MLTQRETPKYTEEEKSDLFIEAIEARRRGARGITLQTELNIDTSPSPFLFAELK
jgi:hypothetical protein